MTSPTEPAAPDSASSISAAADAERANQRLLALRQDIPDALVQIDAVRVDDTVIAIKATIGLPGGARHSFIAAADADTTSSMAAQIAHVQAVAIISALDGLGISPNRQSQVVETGTRKQAPAQADADRESGSAEGDHLPEYSWNAFWLAAKTRGIQRDQLESALGRSVQDATPREAVEALRAAGRWS